MKNYEYKFVEVSAKTFKVKVGGMYDKCKEIIMEEAKNGWRLKQIIIPYNEKFNEKLGVYGAAGYQIIFEKEI